jgi:hypothetical protein
VHSKFFFLFATSLFNRPQSCESFENWKHLMVKEFTPVRDTYYGQYMAMYITSQRTMLGKAYGTKPGAIGNTLGTWERW